MKRRFLTRRVLVIGAGAVLALALGGCATVFTGGGWIISSSGPGQAANFGFTYKVTDPNTGAGTMSGSYTDRDSTGNPWLKISFQDAPSDACYAGSPGTTCNGYNRCVYTDFTYRSNNKAYSNPPTGNGTLFVCDNGQGGKGSGPQPNQNDYISIYLTSGPYSGYGNAGNLQGGNLSAKK